MKQLALAVVTVGCSAGCAIPLYGGALLSRGYADEQVEKIPVDPIDERIVALSFNARRLRFRCEITRKPSATRVETTTIHYGRDWKAKALPLGIAEVIGGALPLALDAGIEFEEPLSKGQKTALTLLTIDGVLLLAGAIGIKSRTETQETIEPAPIEATKQCPLGAELAIEGNRYPLYSDGLTSPAGESAFAQVMTSGNQGFRVVTPRQTIDVLPSADERCQWAIAQESAAVPALCPSLKIPALGLRALRAKIPDSIRVTIIVAP